MSIKNPTLAHFFTHFSSTPVENVRQITPFYAKQSQSQVRQKQHKHLCSNEILKNGHLVIQTNKAKTNPIQTQLLQRAKLMQSVYIQRNMNKNADKGYKKTKPKQSQFRNNSGAPNCPVYLLIKRMRRKQLQKDFRDFFQKLPVIVLTNSGK